MQLAGRIKQNPQFKRLGNGLVYPAELRHISAQSAVTLIRPFIIAEIGIMSGQFFVNIIDFVDDILDTLVERFPGNFQVVIHGQHVLHDGNSAVTLDKFRIKIGA